jgi:hypothetical protein
VFIASIIKNAQAITAYQEGDPCEITSNTYVYGIGIRLGYYLQWLPLTILYFSRLTQDLVSIRAVFNTLGIAVLINIIFSTMKGGLAAIDEQEPSLSRCACRAMKLMPLSAVISIRTANGGKRKLPTVPTPDHTSF